MFEVTVLYSTLETQYKVPWSHLTCNWRLYLSQSEWAEIEEKDHGTGGGGLESPSKVIELANGKWEDRGTSREKWMSPQRIRAKELMSGVGVRGVAVKNSVVKDG